MAKVEKKGIYAHLLCTLKLESSLKSYNEEISFNVIKYANRNLA